MTICIAAHFGNIVAFAADTRTSLGASRQFSFTDGNVKVS